MSKRLVDDAIWRSDKLCEVQPESYRYAYAWLLPLANDVGTFEANAKAIWADAFAVTLPSVTPDDVAKMLDEFERVKLLFRWQVGNKTWAFWVGIDAPGRLPPPTQRYSKDLKPPQEELHKFLGLPYGEPSAALKDAVTGLGYGSGLGSGRGTGIGSGSGTGTGTETSQPTASSTDFSTGENLQPTGKQLTATDLRFPMNEEFRKWVSTLSASQLRMVQAVYTWGQTLSNFTGWRQDNWLGGKMTMKIFQKMAAQYDNFYNAAGVPEEKRPHNLPSEVREELENPPPRVYDKKSKRYKPYTGPVEIELDDEVEVLKSKVFEIEE